MRLRVAVSALLGLGPSLPSSAPAILPHRIAFGEAEVSALQIPVQRGKNKCVNFEYQDFSAVAMGSKAELLLGCLNLQTHVLQLMLQFQSSEICKVLQGRRKGLVMAEVSTQQDVVVVGSELPIRDIWTRRDGCI